MRLAEQALPMAPIIPSEEVRQLRANMHLEETLETIHGLGGVVVSDEDGELRVKMCLQPNLVEIVDGCADSRVISTGTLSACGVDDESIQRTVDEANLRKFGPGSYRRGDGKWMKPPDFVPPDVAGELRKQGWVA